MSIKVEHRKFNGSLAGLLRAFNAKNAHIVKGTPEQAFIHVRRQSDQTISDATATAIDFLSGAEVLLDDDSKLSSWWAPGTYTDRLTCQAEGLYYLGGTISFAANATGTRDIRILTNGGSTAIQRFSPNAAQSGWLSIGCIRKLTPGDTVQLYCYQNSGGNLAAQAYSYSMRLTVALIGNLGSLQGITLPSQDGNGGKYLKTDGVSLSWATVAGGSTPTGTGFRHVTAGTEDAATKLVENADVAAAAAIVESKLSLNYATHTSANDPTADQKAALAGTSGAPSVSNKYVTDADSRNTNSRAPTSHGSGSHTSPTLAAAGNESLGAYYMDIAQIAAPTAPGAGTRRLYVDSGSGKLSARTSAGISQSLEGLPGTQNENLGMYYLDIGNIAAPANPSASYRRLFFDSGTGKLSVRTNAGTTVSLEEQGGGSVPTGTGWRHVTGGVEDAAASTPTKTDVGLGNVDNLQQLNRGANDYAGFTALTIATLDGYDVLLLEDNSDSLNKKKAAIRHILGTSGTHQSLQTLSPGASDTIVAEDGTQAKYINTVTNFVQAVAPKAHGSSSHTGAVLPAGANENFGAYYADMGQIAAPANPGAGVRRLFVDSATGKLSVRTSAGATVSLEESGGGLTAHDKTYHNAPAIPGTGNEDFGGYYYEMDQIAAPANPAAGTRRIYVDSTTGKLSVRTSAGASVSLEEQGGGLTAHDKTYHNAPAIPGTGNEAFGAYYADMSQIAAPANPAAGTRRVFVDSATGKLSVRTDAGATVSLEDPFISHGKTSHTAPILNGNDYVDTWWLRWMPTTSPGAAPAGYQRMFCYSTTGKLSMIDEYGIIYSLVGIPGTAEEDFGQYAFRIGTSNAPTAPASGVKVYVPDSFGKLHVMNDLGGVLPLGLNIVPNIWSGNITVPASSTALIPMYLEIYGGWTTEIASGAYIDITA